MEQVKVVAEVVNSEHFVVVLLLVEHAVPVLEEKVLDAGFLLVGLVGRGKLLNVVSNIEVCHIIVLGEPGQHASKCIYEDWRGQFLERLVVLPFLSVSGIVAL